MPRAARGVARSACPWCGTPEATCELHVGVGSWLCGACNRHGRIMRDRRAGAERGFVHLELAANAAPHAA
jgi:hypothetical protein